MRIRNNKSIYHGMQTTNQDKLSVEVEPFYHYILHFTFYKLLHSQRTTRYSRLEARLQILTKQKIAISPPPTHWISHTNTPLILLSYGSHNALIWLLYCSHIALISRQTAWLGQQLVRYSTTYVVTDCHPHLTRLPGLINFRCEE